MNKSNLDLFKQALAEGLSNRIDRVASDCDTVVKQSKKHTIAMRTIVHGKIRDKKKMTPKMKWIIAITVSLLVILLAGCAIKLRDVIRGFFVEHKGSSVVMTYTDQEGAKDNLDEIYEFSYMPEGYFLEESIISPLSNREIYRNSDGKQIICDQTVLKNSVFLIYDDGSSESMLSINGYDIYHKTENIDGAHMYIWSDGSYAFLIVSHVEISQKEFTNIINGIRVKQ